MYSNPSKHEINGFSIDPRRVVFENGMLISFDVMFNVHHYVGTFENPSPEAPLVTNQDFLKWSNNVPAWIIAVCHDYRDIYFNVFGEDQLSYGFQALVRNLMEYNLIVSEFEHQSLAKSLVFGMNKKRDIIIILSEDVIKQDAETREKFRREFEGMFDSDFLGICSGQGLYYSENMKTEIALTLKFERLSKGLTLHGVVEELNKFGLSLTTASLSRFENNLRHPDFETLAGLFKVLGITYLDNWLDYFQPDFLDIIVEDEFDNFEFNEIDLSNVVPNFDSLDNNEKSLLGDLFLTFYGYLLDYRDKYWINTEVLPKHMSHFSFFHGTILNSLSQKGFVQKEVVNGKEYISLNFDAFIEEAAIALISELHKSNHESATKITKDRS